MTKFAEVIYETGSKSVVSYEDVNTLELGLREHNRRAIAGEPGGPGGHAAERIKRVLLYDEHPGEYNSSGMVNAQSAIDMIGSKAIGGQVSIWEAIAALRMLASPLAARDQVGPHDSMYLAEPTSEFSMEESV